MIFADEREICGADGPSVRSRRNVQDSIIIGQDPAPLLDGRLSQYAAFVNGARPKGHLAAVWGGTGDGKGRSCGGKWKATHDHRVNTLVAVSE
jgi:hypothetical protein